MKSMLKAVSAVALLGTLALPAFADDTTTTTPTNSDAASTDTTSTDAKDQKDLKKVIEDQGINYVETAQKGITLSGYVDTSYTYQFAGSGEYGQAFQNPGGGPGNSQANLRQFDVSNNTFNVNAVKIALEKALPDKNEWAAGFRIDTIYGSDAAFLGDSAFNFNNAKGTGGTGTINDSGLAIEQALVKFRIPIGNGLDIYAGKFVTFLGYEVIESPANLNFSRGLLFTNLIPLTNTGVYADYKFNSTVEAKLAVVDGWNNSTSPSSVTDRSNFGKAIMGQLTINAPGGNANITNSFIYSPQGEPGDGTAGGFNTGSAFEGVYDVWGNWNPTFVKDGALLLGFNGDLGQAAGSGFYGIALYAQYKFTKVFSLAGRAEYIHDDSSNQPKFGVVGANGVAGAQDDYAYTLTASFNMWDNLLTRVEYRLDDLTGSSTGGNGHQVNSEISLNAVYSF
jgi:hypothetical protein